MAMLTQQATKQRLHEVSFMSSGWWHCSVWNPNVAPTIYVKKKNEWCPLKFLELSVVESNVVAILFYFIEIKQNTGTYVNKLGLYNFVVYNASK